MIDRALFALEGIRGALAALVALAVARALLVVGQAWSLASAIVHLWEGAPLPDQAPLIVLFFLCFVGGQLVRYAQDSYLDRYAYARIDALRRELLQAVFGQGARIVQAQGTGSVTAMVLEGIDQVETYLRLILPKIVCVVVVPLIVLLCVFPVDWVSGSIMLVMYPVIVFYMGLIGATAKAAASLQHEEYQRLSNHFIDSMRGIDTLKLFGRGKRHGERIFEVSERFREATVKTLRIATLSGSVLDLISTLSLAAVAIMLGFRLVDGSIAFFPALFVLVLVPEYFKPIREFASDYHASTARTRWPPSRGSSRRRRRRRVAPRTTLRRHATLPRGAKMRRSSWTACASRIPSTRRFRMCPSPCAVSRASASSGPAARARARS